MKWNWQKHDWPQFTYEKSALADFEARFLHESGIFLGALKHVSVEDKDMLVIELMSTEALKTYEYAPGKSHRPSVPRGAGRFQGRPQRGKIHQHRQDISRNGHTGLARPA